MKIIYRISDSKNNKNRPNFFCKRKIFKHFLNIFKNYEIYVIADNISEQTYNFLLENILSSKIIRTSTGNGFGFLYAIEFAINIFDINEQLYFAEDDYIYTVNSPLIIQEGLQIADYVSGYDHPDKYINHLEGGPNPFIQEGGELTRVLITKSTHWKLTNSCCMTFATHVKILKEDYPIYKHFCSTSNAPEDFPMFCYLIQNKKRKLISSLPGVSTHCETELLSPFINWNNII